MKNLLSTFTIILFLAVGGYAQIYFRNYSPLTKREMKNTFPVAYVGHHEIDFSADPKKRFELPISGRIQAGASKISITHYEGEIDNGLTISGKDKQQKKWSVEYGSYSPAYPIKIYTGDLDQNGLRDLMLLISTGGNGLAPVNTLFVLTFDQRGRPVPFQIDGYFSGTEKNILDLVDLDGDGNAELLHVSLHGGFWITNFYRVQNARWQKVVGKLKGRSYPLHTRFTKRINHRSEKPGVQIFTPDLSNTTPNFTGKLISFKGDFIPYEWAESDGYIKFNLKVSLPDGKILSTGLGQYIVIDDSYGRKIISSEVEDSYLDSVLEEIAAGDYQVNLYGQLEKGKNSPELLWASL